MECSGSPRFRYGSGVGGSFTPRRVQPRAFRGSQKWLQLAVNQHVSTLNRVVAGALQIEQDTTIEWVSPLEDDEFAEYRDSAFLGRLGIDLQLVPLKSFWPRGGPCWDALGRLDTASPILVEAKAHVGELDSAPCQAEGKSLEKIRAAFAEIQTFFGADSGSDWCSRFYQYANRLAHIYLLRELNGLDAHLVFLHFVNDVDMGGPTSISEWDTALGVVHEALGMRAPTLGDGIVHAFMDVSMMQEIGLRASG